MELKQEGISMADAAATLLIVPYGIETSHGWPILTLTCLLIIPYGIETKLVLS